MFVKRLQGVLGEPWLAFNRLLTSHTLEWKLRSCPRTLQYTPEPGSMLYVAASSLPYHTSGYTTRTHEIIRALCAAGGKVHAVTRPGYPWDRKDRQRDADGEETVVGDVGYRHIPAPLNLRPVLQYALQAAPQIAEIAVRERAAVIHAASNHVNALPALLAARRLGLPFQYEMRGLWELTRISRMPHYEGSQGYRQGLQLEGLVARHADRLFVISEQLGNYVRDDWGICSDRMGLLPNCVDPDRFTPADPQNVEPNTIGYAGSLISYEGLDTLIEAVEVMTREGKPVKVYIIGDGEACMALKAKAVLLNVTNRIRFMGKMSPEVAREMLGRCALVCIPRKPFKVCRIVPPIKLVEALAMAKPVIVPDLPVFRDEMGKSPTGLFFKAGDAVDLARVISEALFDREALAALGMRAREYAVKQRSWRNFVTDALPVQQG